MNMKKFLALALALLTLLSLTACGSKDAGDSPFLDMDTVDLEGNPVTSEFFAQNKLTLVNVWDINCTACVEEMPVLQQLTEDYAEKGFTVLGLYYTGGEELTDSDREKIDEILADAEAEFPHILASDSMMLTKQLKKVHFFPTSYFVDAQGNIVGKTVGSNDYAGWEEVIGKEMKKVESNG